MAPLPFLPAQTTAESVLFRPGDRALKEALAILRERRGVDFAGYRKGTIERRLADRMVVARTPGPAAYLDLLRGSESEIDRLASSFTIKVSRFYRNAFAFDFLRGSAIPGLRERFPGEPLRAWSAGCAGGEEAYTLAMLLSDGDADVCGTDLDDPALAAARDGRYAAGAFTEAPEPLVREFVEPTGEPGILAVADVLRRRVRFLRHDLGGRIAPAGAPFHLVCCRNVLIYFGRPLQRRALRLLVESLVPGGVLCLGEAEWPTDEMTSLLVLDRKSKVFRRIS